MGLGLLLVGVVGVALGSPDVATSYAAEFQPFMIRTLAEPIEAAYAMPAQIAYDDEAMSEQMTRFAQMQGVPMSEGAPAQSPCMRQRLSAVNSLMFEEMLQPLLAATAFLFENAAQQQRVHPCAQEIEASGCESEDCLKHFASSLSRDCAVFLLQRGAPPSEDVPRFTIVMRRRVDDTTDDDDDDDDDDEDEEDAKRALERATTDFRSRIAAFFAEGASPLEIARGSNAADARGANDDDVDDNDEHHREHGHGHRDDEEHTDEHKHEDKAARGHSEEAHTHHGHDDKHDQMVHSHGQGGEQYTHSHHVRTAADQEEPAVWWRYAETRPQGDAAADEATADDEDLDEMACLLFRVVLIVAAYCAVRRCCRARALAADAQPDPLDVAEHCTVQPIVVPPPYALAQPLKEVAPAAKHAPTREVKGAAEKIDML
jgi:hypothetical protein